jgi:hypothetical protein
MIHDVDPFVRARPICEMLGGRSRRTLYEMVKRGDFPPPDRPQQRRGEPDLWRMSTVRRGLQDYGRSAASPESREVA